MAPSRCDREEEYLAEVEAWGRPPDALRDRCFCEGACAASARRSARPPRREADADYDAHVNR